MSKRKVGITVDFLDDVMLNVFTRDKIGWLLEMFARHGIGHVNWYYQPPHTGLFRDCGIMREMLESLKHVPDHLETAIKVGHDLGLEMFTTFKPYEEGMGFSFPRGSAMDRKYGRIDRIGGRSVWVTDWISEHPHLRVERRMDDVPDDILDVVIDRIELDKRDNVPVGLTRDGVRVYVSRDNVKYEELTSGWQLREEVVPALLLDFHMAHNNVNDAYLQELERDETVTGVMFYEAYSTYEEKNGRFELKPEFAEPFQRFMERNNDGRHV